MTRLALTLALLTGCQSIPVTYSEVWLGDKLNGLDHVFKVVVDHGIVEEVPRDWVRGPSGYYVPKTEVKR